MNKEHLRILVEGLAAAEPALKLHAPNGPIARLLALPAMIEWSGVRRGQGFGPHGSGGDGVPYPACPDCGGLKEPNGEFIDEAVGHRSGCRLAALLGSPTVIPEGETGRLAV